MPNLAFSPGPQQPPAPPTPITAGEKENASSGSKSLLADPSPRRCSSGTGGGGSGGRTPLESLSPDGEGVSATAPPASAPATSSAGTGAGVAVDAAAAAMVCLRNSSCKCPDCDMAASVFGIDQLRKVGSSRRDSDGGGDGDEGGGVGGDGGGGGGGGAVSSPTPGVLGKVGSVAMARTPPPNGGSSATAATDSPPETATMPATPTPAVASPQDEAEPVSASPAAAAMPPATPAAVTPASLAATPTVSSVVKGGEEVSATPTSAARSEGGRRESAGGGGEAETPESAAAAVAAAEADSGSGKKKKGVGWGFRMARAVFSPGVRLSPGKYLAVCGGGASQIIEADESGAHEEKGLKGEAESEREEDMTAPASTTSAVALPTVPLSGGGGGGSRRSSIEGGIEKESLLSGDDEAKEEEDELDVEGREEGAMGGEEEEAEVAAAAGTCRPPTTADDGGGTADAATEERGFDVNGVSGGGEKEAPRRVSRGGRRLSKDVFFECSSEADVVVASSDSENSDIGRQSEQDPATATTTATATASTTTKTPTSGGTQSSAFPLSGGTSNTASSETGSVGETPTAVAAVAATAAAGGSGGGDGLSPVVSPPSLRLSRGGDGGPDPAALAAVEAAVAAAAAAAIGGSTADSATTTVNANDATAAAAAPVLAGEGGRGVDAARADAAQGEGQPDGAGRSAPALGRRRNRRVGTRLELGMVGAYGHENDMAKFSQSEVNAMIKERLAEEQGAFDKTLSALKESHAEELQVAAQELQRSSSDGNRAKIAAKDAEALEREIAMLSERYGEAASEARSTGKALREKEALLDAVTNQLMGLKADLANIKTEHDEEKQAIQEAAEEERLLRCAAEGSLAQLEASYNRLEDSEREKRAAGILKMKMDMQALAQAQFGEANKKFNAMKARLDSYEVETRRLKEAAEAQEKQVKEAGQTAEELRLQLATAEKEHADSAAEAARRERLLQDELDALREESEARLDEMDAIARERDAANTGRDVSQDALARMAIRNTQMKESVSDLEGKVKELEGFCTEALDELDQERANSAALAATIARK